MDEVSTPLTVSDVIQALVQLDSNESEVGVSFNNSDPFTITDFTVDENETTGNKKITFQAS